MVSSKYVSMLPIQKITDMALMINYNYYLTGIFPRKAGGNDENGFKDQ